MLISDALRRVGRYNGLHHRTALGSAQSSRAEQKRPSCTNLFRFRPYELPLELPGLGDAATSAAADAAVTLARLDERVRSSKSLYLNHLLIRSESLSSSWIEGNRLAPKKLSIAEHLRHGDRVALDVIANVRATAKSIDELSDPDKPVTVSDIEDLQHSIEPRLEARSRTEQNWVGGPGNCPMRAEFVPPPPTEVPRLIENLAEFISRTDGNPVIRAAIAHAQFETLHPFIDGNGRTGRALVPVSTVFVSNTKAFIGGLTAFRRDASDLDGWTTSLPRRLSKPHHPPSSSAKTSKRWTRRSGQTSSIIDAQSESRRHSRDPAPSSSRSSSDLPKNLS